MGISSENPLKASENRDINRTTGPHTGIPPGVATMRNAAVRSNLLVPEVREVMDIRQASDYLGISPDTLYKYASEGFIPAFKLGNRWRFKRSRLDEWMDRQSEMQVADVNPDQKKPPRAAM
jgi:excisionase family DNA binding protein